MVSAVPKVGIHGEVLPESRLQQLFAPLRQEYYFCKREREYNTNERNTTL